MAFSFGVCCMESKATSSAMRSLLEELNIDGDFEVTIFAENIILQEPVENWPRVKFLLAFASANFPLDKCRAYCELVQPVLVNDVDAQFIFRDRVEVYRRMESWSIPCPAHVIIDHLSPSGSRDFEQGDDWIRYKGQTIKKSFVEKPRDGDRHDIWIYYPTSGGGGATKLFRKVGDKSSDYDRDQLVVREDGIYIYEGFLETDDLDYKCYAVGPTYVHAEARKSPAVDGEVIREKGKEKRKVVILTEAEQDISARVIQAFGQFVCGFDILRTKDGKSIVCDLNGWSSVKGNPQYTRRAAALIREKLLQHRYGDGTPSPGPSALDTTAEQVAPMKTCVAAKTWSTVWRNSLRAIVAIGLMVGFVKFARRTRHPRSWTALASIVAWIFAFGNARFISERLESLLKKTQTGSSRHIRLGA